jgi:hypothetical protein
LEVDAGGIDILLVPLKRIGLFRRFPDLDIRDLVVKDRPVGRSIEGEGLRMANLRAFGLLEVGLARFPPRRRRSSPLVTS